MAGVRPFPVGGPVRPESRQIGRRPAIDGLEQQLLEHRQHTLLIGKRRIGKSSVAIAALDRPRNSDRGWALEVDLSRGPIRDSAALADRIAEQARAAGVRIRGPGKHAWAKFARKGLGMGGSGGFKAAAKLLGLPAFVTIGDLAAFVDQGLAPVDAGGEETLDVRSVLLAIQAAACAEKRPTVLFFDEIQRIASDEYWIDRSDAHGTQTAIAELMEAPEGEVVVVLAGSDGEAMQRLFAEGQPLRFDGMIFPIPDISPDDWHHGLGDRFAEVGIDISAGHIDRILDASGGHPQRTMRVCAHIQQLYGPGYDVTEALIDAAINQAREHPSWPS